MVAGKGLGAKVKRPRELPHKEKSKLSPTHALDRREPGEETSGSTSNSPKMVSFKSAQVWSFAGTTSLLVIHPHVTTLNVSSAQKMEVSVPNVELTSEQSKFDS